jgi:hypothetical protein
MSEQQQGAPPAGGEPPAPPPEPAKPAVLTFTNEAFNKRLEEERASNEAKFRASFLKELGVEKLEDAKTRIAAAQKLEQDKLSETEKLNLRIKELEPHQATAERVGTRFKALVDGEFGKLPEAAQKAIDEHAGGDAEKRFDMIELMRKSGALEALSKGAVPPEPPKPPGPANSGPGTPPPPPSGTPTKFEEWQAMKGRNPVMGDIFYNNHQREIERTRPAAS